jgi:hypothetical protein
VFRFDMCCSFEIGNSSRHFQDAVIHGRGLE